MKDNKSTYDATTRDKAGLMTTVHFKTIGQYFGQGCKYNKETMAGFGHYLFMKDPLIRFRKKKYSESMTLLSMVKFYIF